MKKMGLKKGDIFFSAAFLSPALILYMGLIILPILMSGYISLTKWNGVGIPEFVGLRNFNKIFHDLDYWTSFTNTLQAIVFSLLLQLPLGLIFAYLLSRIKLGYKFFRSIYFLPTVISPTAIGTMFLILFNGNLGPLNTFLRNVGLPTRDWLSDPKTVLYAVMFPMIWQYIGHYVIIFLAGIQSIPEVIHYLFQNYYSHVEKSNRRLYCTLLYWKRKGFRPSICDDRRRTWSKIVLSCRSNV